MYDKVRNRYFYPVNESGEEVNLATCEKPRKDYTPQKEKRNSFTSFFRKKFDELQYAIKGAWEPKYIGGKLEVIQHGEKKKVVAYSKSDDDKIVVWDKADAAVKSASWEGSTIVLYCGFGLIHLYGPNNNDF